MDEVQNDPRVVEVYLGAVSRPRRDGGLGGRH